MRVKSANLNGNFGKEASLAIRLASHPWRSTKAYFIYAASLLVIIIAFFFNQRRQKRVLERLVKQRTALLASRNAELRATDRIVSTINKVLQPNEVLQALTREVHDHFPGADRVSYILFDPVTRLISITAACGEGSEKQADFTDPVIRQQQRLFQKALKQVAEGVYIAHDFASQVTLPLLGPGLPTSLICLEIRIEDHVDGYLAIANLRDPNSFRHMDVETLSRVRQHAISALAKARSITELVTAQKALIENAHASGMAELAMEVMHNIGTQANNAKTSAQLAMEKSNRLDDSPSLTRLAEMIEKDPEADRLQVVSYLHRLSARQGKVFKDLHAEMARLDFHLQEITRDLFAQQKHAGANPTQQTMDLNQVLDEVLHTDRYLLKMESITVQRAYELNAKIRANPTQLERVITYALGNAREAMAGRPESCITVTTGQEAAYGYFIIRDNGVGIEPEHLEAVFRPGFSTYSDKRGFGLHYCANSLKEMGGRVTIHSNGVGLGAEVRCYLPLSGDATGH